MRRAYSGIVIVMVAVLALSACGKNRKTPQLMTFRNSGSGPDEFSILPTKPLQAPEFSEALPPPTPGGTNLTDPTPRADAVAALGGRPEQLQRTGVVQGDVALVSHTTRYGVASDIRTALAADDENVRRGNREQFLRRIFGANLYYRTYKDQTLDEFEELERFRNLGVRTPSAPPLPE